MQSDKKIENNKKEPIKIERENKEIEATATATRTEHGSQHRGTHAHTHKCCIYEMGISKRKIEN